MTPPPGSIALSTSSVYPESTEHAFGYAAKLGYDGVEVMVGPDAASQSITEVQDLSERYQVPVVSVHSPCLLMTQFVWGSDPWRKLEMSAEMAHEVGADVVVVHPPFRWQQGYADQFMRGIEDLEHQTELTFAVENMYPWRIGRTREIEAYAPGWNVAAHDFAHTTLDLSHAASSHSDSLVMAQAMGSRLAHVHMTDGTGSARDEHLVPGRGKQPCAEVLQHLANSDYPGHVVLEVSTRSRARGDLAREVREADLIEALNFCREYFRRTDEAPPSSGSAPRGADERQTEE